jgi:hypothetical protein
VEILDAVEEVIEEAFPPKAGGLVDRARKRAAKEEAEKQEYLNVAERVEQASYKAVKTAQESPEGFSAITFTIPPGGNAPILPLSKYRYRATVFVITAGATVILAKDSGAAVSGVGFTLPYGFPVPFMTRAQVYAYNNTAGIVQVSVAAEIYAPEK